MDAPARKTEKEILELSTAFAEGRIFSSMHIALSDDYKDKYLTVLLVFLSVASDWKWVTEHKLVPYQYTNRALMWVSRVPPQPIFEHCEFMYQDECVQVMKQGALLHKAMRLKPDTPD